LHSLHVDIVPGDRANLCKGLMAPVGLTFKTKKGLQLIHECLKCQKRSVNKVAKDTVQEDNYQMIILLQGL
jgi:hypothetical protein